MGSKQNESTADILFKTEDNIFSYRVAGILIHEGKVLLQNTTDDEGYAFPGGHVAFGETNTEALIREFKEEINASITVNGLKWVAEIFFPWGNKPCHQICNYYLISLNEKSIPMTGTFAATEGIEGRNFKVMFHWIPLDEIDNTAIYPTNAKKLLGQLDGGVQHFVYREK